MNMNQQAPFPRQGLAGSLDRLIGPGATRNEIALEMSAAILAGLAAPAYAVWKDFDWNLFQLVIAGIFAFDMAGGIVTNATPAARRWYHRKGRAFWQHFAFVAAHVFHIGVVTWLWGLDWMFFGVTVSWLLAAAVIILGSPCHLRLSIALLCYAVALLICLYGLGLPAGLEWFLPFLFLKLLVSHLPPPTPTLSVT
jgi:hypothetical protein